MNPPAWVAFTAAVILSACAQSTPEQQVVNDAAEALGGRDRLLAVKTVVLEGEGSAGNLGQDMTMEANGQQFTLSPHRSVIDVAGGRMRVEQSRTPNFAYFQGPQTQKIVQGLDGDVGYNVASSGTATRISTPAAGDRRAEFYHHPLTLVRAALDPAATLGNPQTLGNQRSVDVTIPGGRTITLAIDATTKLPTRIVHMAYHPNLGDVAVETSFSDYQDVNGLRLPARLASKIDQYETMNLRLAKQTVDGDVGDLAAPATAASAAPFASPPPANVTAQEVSKGIWFLAGQSHHSVLVEFSDHLTLVEFPQSEARTLAVIAKARELRPGKPLTHAVNSHHHFDHSAGLRAAVSEGLTIITHRVNAPFFQEAVERKHTLGQDALGKNPRPLKIETVDDELVLKDDTMTVNLYHAKGSPHGDAILLAYFPKERVLSQADLYSPNPNPGAAFPYLANLVENVKNRNLKVDRIVPLHGAIVPYAEAVRSLPAVVPR
jgi:glyoxylase-like metal-dependent hydrolase (beta-lactamase superfamily II)